MAAAVWVLAGFGLLVLILVAIGMGWFFTAGRQQLEEVATPYREGLHAAMRIHEAAMECEWQLREAAERYLTSDGRGGGF